MLYYVFCESTQLVHLSNMILSVILNIFVFIVHSISFINVQKHKDQFSIWASTPENLSLGFKNNKGADQAAHPRRLISTFVIPFMKSIISKLATSEISIF